MNQKYKTAGDDAQSKGDGLRGDIVRAPVLGRQGLGACRVTERARRSHDHRALGLLASDSFRCRAVLIRR
jgi:hypothetical protein